MAYARAHQTHKENCPAGLDGDLPGDSSFVLPRSSALPSSIILECGSLLPLLRCHPVLSNNSCGAAASTGKAAASRRTPNCRRAPAPSSPRLSSRPERPDLSCAPNYGASGRVVEGSWLDRSSPRSMGSSPHLPPPLLFNSFTLTLFNSFTLTLLYCFTLTHFYFSLLPSAS